LEYVSTDLDVIRVISGNYWTLNEIFALLGC